MSTRDAEISDDFVDARVAPRGSLENLSQREMERLQGRGQGGLHRLFRQCALAVLNSGQGVIFTIGLTVVMIMCICSTASKG